MNFLVRTASALLQASLVLYPAHYRREYEEERACILRLALEEVATGGWLPLLRFCSRELRDLPLSLIREHLKERKLQMNIDGDQLESNQEPGYVIWMGLLPFVLLGAMVMFFEIPREWVNQSILMSLGGLLMFGGYPIILAGLLVGALAGFPRWSFPYLIYAIIFAFYVSHAATPGLVVFNIEIWGGDLWGWRAWVPLGIVIVLVLLINRHPRVLLKKLWGNITKNWSYLTFGLYGLLPLFMFISFDEMDNLYSFPGAVAGAILLLIGAFLYLRIKSPFWRTFGLVAFAFLGILTVKATVYFYWDTHSINIVTNERHLLNDSIPYASILVKAVRGALNTILFLLLPGIVVLLGYIKHFALSVINRLQRSG